MPVSAVQDAHVVADLERLGHAPRGEFDGLSHKRTRLGKLGSATFFRCGQIERFRPGQGVWQGVRKRTFPSAIESISSGGKVRFRNADVDAKPNRRRKKSMGTNLWQRPEPNQRMPVLSGADSSPGATTLPCKYSISAAMLLPAALGQQRRARSAKRSDS
jgi:hypothetical protein